MNICDGDDDDDVKDCAQYHIANYRQFLLLNKLNHHEVYTVERLGPVVSQRPWNPSDIYCGKCIAVVRFRADRPISVVSYGFFGPLESQCHGKYHMEIELLTEDYHQIARAEIVTPVQKRCDIFHVKFDQPIPILPCTWYNAKFSLLGPPTGQSQKIYSSKQVKCGEYENVMFKFEEPDSNQLPEISFILRY